MIERELLLNPWGGGGIFGEYTHIVGVDSLLDNNTKYIGFGFDNFGTLTPSVVEDYNIITLYSSYSSEISLTFIQFDAPPAEQMNLELYIGREEYNIAEKFTYVAWMAIIKISLFLEDDVGKDVPIWLATTPPPLVSGLKRATVTSLKEVASC